MELERRRPAKSSSFSPPPAALGGGTFARRLSFPQLVIASAPDSFMKVASFRLVLPPVALISAPETIHLAGEGNKRAAVIEISVSRNKCNEHNNFLLFIHAFVDFFLGVMFCRVILRCRPVSDL